MNATLTRYSPRMLAILRIVTALLFMEHGTQKLFHFPPMAGSPGGGGGGPGAMPAFMGTLFLIAGAIIVEAVRRQDKAEDLARATELRVRTDALAARQRYETSLAEVATLRQDVLPGAQSAFDAATKGFELGKFSYLEALDAQRTLLQSRAQYLRALADAHRSVTDVQRLLGPDSASAPPSSTSSQERP